MNYKFQYIRVSYKAGYRTAEVPGNLNLHETTVAESNHAAIIRHFGDFGTWSIVYHMKRLL